ncbi:hypothetical protein A4X06_0g5728 [Tilletia controversa]|uniref:Uncharacterized protein n=1 Tax=Tilletia controversa TaxID=13291 RepID=A0A8X7MQJ5_9BASI|nr:hypothetical protein A4X06_0g5728 [Tilletia controversa]
MYLPRTGHTSHSSTSTAAAAAITTPAAAIIAPAAAAAITAAAAAAAASTVVFLPDHSQQRRGAPPPSVTRSSTCTTQNLYSISTQWTRRQYCLRRPSLWVLLQPNQWSHFNNFWKQRERQESGLWILE